MNTTDLKRVLDLHAKWLAGDENGERADLRDAYLRDADLRDAYLGGADLRGAYLRDAYLRGADLRGADLRGADLRGAYLRDAYLGVADLRGADLRDAYLRGADLRGADLRGAKVTRDGRTISEYMRTLPELLTAGGRTVTDVAAHWDCHTWVNCPMHAAFNARNLNDVPAEWRGRADEFITLFDAGVLPRPEVNQ